MPQKRNSVSTILASNAQIEEICREGMKATTNPNPVIVSPTNDANRNTPREKYTR